eukprot:4535761-Prymnesium_polylepis.1
MYLCLGRRPVRDRSAVHADWPLTGLWANARMWLAQVRGVFRLSASLEACPHAQHRVVTLVHMSPTLTDVACTTDAAVSFQYTHFSLH